MTLLKTEHLKPAFGADIEGAARMSHPGMAHFAGSGPDGKRCSDCTYFLWKETKGGPFYSQHGMRAGTLKSARCAEFTRLMQQHGNAVPPHTLACKYFRQTTTPPKKS